MNNFKNIILYGHGGSTNHGCEAIVKTTQKILEAYNENLRYTLSTLDMKADEQFILNIYQYIENTFIKPKILQYCITAIGYKILKRPVIPGKIIYRNFFRSVKKINKNSLFFSIGGDNYCCENPSWLYLHNNSIDRIGSQRVLWGCSVEPKYINKKMIKDLSGYSLITARESITFNALTDKNIKTHIKLYSDPAFTLEVDTSKVPKYISKEKTIGINLSPMVATRGGSKSIIYSYYYRLAEYILKNTKYNIVFIPHVSILGNSDYHSMFPLYKALKESNRVYIIGNSYNASQYKGIISNCCMFIGARTHATIAACSTCVPTLALGYSVKSKGIFRDIFGDEKGLVLPIQEVTHERQLINSFNQLCERKNDLIKHLQAVMPSYIEKAWQAGEEVRKLLED